MIFDKTKVATLRVCTIALRWLVHYLPFITYPVRYVASLKVH